MCFPMNSLFFPNILQGSIIQEDDAFFFDDIFRLLRSQKIKIRLANMITTRFYRQQLRIIETRMHSPFIKTDG